ncbi:MAG: hypothetical protein FWE57_06940 [Chitinispirillia bacterium]|nr:hypothetical protein [Chitinispirillia bacterium]
MAGAGTGASPYIITEAEQLAFLATRVNAMDANFNNKHYRLVLTKLRHRQTGLSPAMLIKILRLLMY